MGELRKGIEGMLVVPHSLEVMALSFENFLWDNEYPAYLVRGNEWIRMPESGETGLGLRVAPGSA